VGERVAVVGDEWGGDVESGGCAGQLGEGNREAARRRGGWATLVQGDMRCKRPDGRDQHLDATQEKPTS
jgi:hypothetical protein